jgi:hypothetical protein
MKSISSKDLKALRARGVTVREIVSNKPAPKSDGLDQQVQVLAAKQTVDFSAMLDALEGVSEQCERRHSESADLWRSTFKVNRGGNKLISSLDVERTNSQGETRRFVMTFNRDSSGVVTSIDMTPA